jgi:5-methylthioadenosine/S-adenosylhomocysteine deaminase
VYSARGSDVRTVIVGGQVVVRDRSVTTVDEERVCREVSDRARQARATI